MKEIDWNIEGYQLIKKPTWFYDDPVYVRLSERILKKFNISNYHLDINENDLRADMFLLNIEGEVVLTKVTYWRGGLDGSGIYYTLDLPNVNHSEIA